MYASEQQQQQQQRCCKHVRDVDSIRWQGNVALFDGAQSDRLIGDFKGAEHSNRSVTVSHDHRVLLHDHLVDVVAGALEDTGSRCHYKRSHNYCPLPLGAFHSESSVKWQTGGEKLNKMNRVHDEKALRVKTKSDTHLQLRLAIAVDEALCRVALGVDTAVEWAVKVQRQHHVLLVALYADCSRVRQGEKRDVI